MQKLIINTLPNKQIIIIEDDSSSPLLKALSPTDKLVIDDYSKEWLDKISAVLDRFSFSKYTRHILLTLAMSYTANNNNNITTAFKHLKSQKAVTLSENEINFIITALF